MTRVELLRAATWSKDFDLADALDAIREELGERGFVDLEERAILRNLSASQGGGFTIDQIEILRAATLDQKREAARVTQEAYRRTVDFLTSQIGIVSTAGLPYANQLTVLAEAFRLLPNSPSPAIFAALRRWFWRTSLGSYFGGWNTGQMTADHKAVHSFTSGVTSELVVDALRHDPLIWSSRPFRSNAALSKTFALLLARNNPRDLLTGQPIDTRAALSWTNQKEFHHFFPKKVLKAQNVASDKINMLANIVFLTSASNKIISGKQPVEYLTEARGRLGAEFDAVMASNIVSPSALHAAFAGDYDAFLQERSANLESAAAALAEWPRDVPTASMAESDEGEAGDDE